MISREQAFQLWDEFMLPEIIRRHCRKVNEIALFLAGKAKQRQLEVDMDVIDAASLLHDLFKPVEFFEKMPSAEFREFWQVQKEKYGGEHCQAAYKYLNQHEPAIAKVILKHCSRYLSELKDLNEKIVKYADVRVNHDTVVLVKTRWNEGKKRYSIPYEKMVPLELFLALEKELCENLGFAPEDLFVFNENRGMPT